MGSFLSDVFLLEKDIDDGHAAAAPVIAPRKEELLFISQRKKDLLFLRETKGCCILPFFFSAVRVFSSKGNLLLRYLYGFTVSGGESYFLAWAVYRNLLLCSMLLVEAQKSIIN